MTQTTTPGTAPSAVETSTAPPRAGLVLVALVLVAAVANLNLSVANVALPDIGKAFNSSQTSLDLIAVGYSLGLAASVLYLGALGDRYGRKMMLVLGISLSIPACIAAAYAPSDGFLVLARIVGGVSAGMAFPTTLALITALWSGPARTRSIALWSAVGGALSALGPLVAGAMLQHFWWGSVFLVTLPLAALALVLAIRLVPSHVNETSDPVDNLGGILALPFPTRARWPSVSERSRSPPPPPSSSANAGPGTRSTTCTSPPAASSGSPPAPGSSCSAR
jgi:DHA2 family multidrug resistance protein-like MFS transporter